jgi:hypothetical protein
MPFNPYAHTVASDTNPGVFRTFASLIAAQVWRDALVSDGHTGIYLLSRTSESDPSFYVK